MKNNEPLGMGGIVELWHDPAGEVATIALLTTAPNQAMAEIRNRMPVNNRPESYAEWLDASVTDVNRLHHLIGPYPQGHLAFYPMGLGIDTPGSDGTGLIKRLGNNLTCWCRSQPVG